MSFLSQQSFDENGEVKVIVAKRKVFEAGEIDQVTGHLVGTARIKYDYDALTRDDIVNVGNLRAAEVLVMEEGEIFWGTAAPPLHGIADDCILAHKMSLAASNIKTMSKRGFGNTFVVHPTRADEVREAFGKLKTVQQYDEETEDMVDVQIPYFQGEPDLFEDEVMDTEQVLVIYRGQDGCDQPLIYIEGEGLLMNSKVALVEDYGKFVRI